MTDTKPTWDDYFMAQLPLIAARSHDPNTKCSCLVVGPDHEIRTSGYNGFPRGVDEARQERYERPEKYFWMEHAERNAIYNAARIGVSLKDCTMYLSWFPCMDCARAIVQVGITRLVCDRVNSAARRNDPKWKGDFDRVDELLSEGGVDLVWWVGATAHKKEFS